MVRQSLILVVSLHAFAAATAQVDNLRISEVSGVTNQAEVLNSGPAFVTPSVYPFCHLFNYMSTIPAGTSFAAGERKVFTVTGLANGDADIFLYTSMDFANPNDMVHGCKYGPAASIGRTPEAVAAGLWPSVSAFAPAPTTGLTLAYDGFGFSPFDWYLDQTPTFGTADSTTPGTVPAGLAIPMGSQSFESVMLGDTVLAITDWVVVDTSGVSGMFTVRAVNDVRGVVGPHGGSTRWLRIRDQDSANQNRFYSNTLVNPMTTDYAFTFFVNLEETPPGGANGKPRFTVQHDDDGFMNAWGIEFADTGASLIVTGIGGTPASTPLYPLSSPTGLGDWVKLKLIVRFSSNQVAATFNDGPETTLPISLSPTADAKTFRLCFRGEGAGNVSTLLLDDVSIETMEPAPCPGDTDGDRMVGNADLQAVLDAWASSFGDGNFNPDADFNQNNMIDNFDLQQLLDNWAVVCP